MQTKSKINDYFIKSIYFNKIKNFLEVQNYLEKILSDKKFKINDLIFFLYVRNIMKRKKIFKNNFFLLFNFFKLKNYFYLNKKNIAKSF